VTGINLFHSLWTNASSLLKCMLCSIRSWRIVYKMCQCCLTFRSEYLFNFDRTFEIHDDIEVLKRMGLSFGLEKGHCTTGDLSQAVKMVPKSLEPYVRGMRTCQLFDFHSIYFITTVLHYFTQHQYLLNCDCIYALLLHYHWLDFTW